jgi:hypothetical protein
MSKKDFLVGVSVEVGAFSVASLIVGGRC